MSSHPPMSDTQACDLMRVLATEAIRMHPIYRRLREAVRELNGVIAQKKIDRESLEEIVGELETLLNDFED